MWLDLTFLHFREVEPTLVSGYYRSYFSLEKKLLLFYAKALGCGSENWKGFLSFSTISSEKLVRSL